MSKPIGFYRDKKKTHPVHAATSKRGYNASNRPRVPHQPKYGNITKDEAARIHESRSPTAKGTDEAIKAPIAGSPGEWAAHMNRLDLPGIDDPAEEDEVRPSPKEKAEASKVELKPENRVDVDPIPKDIDGIQWELDHLHGLAITRAQKAGEKNVAHNVENYYTPYEKARQQELLDARRRIYPVNRQEEAQNVDKWVDYWRNKKEVYAKVGKTPGELEEAISRHKASLVLGREFGEDPHDYLKRKGLTEYYGLSTKEILRRLDEPSKAPEPVKASPSRPPPPGANITREVTEEWMQKGRKAAEEYNAIVAQTHRERREPTPEERLKMNELKGIVSDANKAHRIYETQPKGPKPSAGRGFKEEATLVDISTGAVVATSKGERNSVKMAIPKTGAFKHSHTHPSDAPHSVKDVFALISHDPIREMEVVTPNRIYTLSKTEKTPSAYVATRVYGASPSALSRGSRAKFRGDEFHGQEDLIRNIASELHLDYRAQDR